MKETLPDEALRTGAQPIRLPTLRVLALVFVQVLAGASAQSNVSRAESPLPTPQSLKCFDQAYAEVKKGATTSEGPVPEESNTADDTGVNEGHILNVNHRLGEPVEIARIRRGYLTHFLGTARNDGLEGWTGVDVVHAQAISITRRIYDKRASRTHPFKDPAFTEPHILGHIFGRKFSTGDRTELEVIATVPIDPSVLEALICILNAAWAVEVDPPMTSSDGFINTRLFDSQTTGKRLTFYGKSINHTQPIDSVMSQTLRSFLPKAAW
jgi:hypothetical protein